VAFDPTRTVFVNLWSRRAGGRVSYQAEVFTDPDDAALDAASPSIYAYAGTVCALPGGETRFADLSGRGAGLRRDDASAARDETAHERGLRQGAGRTVL